jgi:glutathione S-transferase
MTTITVPKNYGFVYSRSQSTLANKPTSYVLAVSLVATPLLAFVHGTITGAKRRAAKIPYPNAYATPQEAKANPAAHTFNCAQRAHAQFMENAPQTMMYMLVAGLEYPNATAGLGVGWLVCRVLYLYGYVYQDKKAGSGRYLGVAYHIAQAGLWGLVGAMALKIIS